MLWIHNKIIVVGPNSIAELISVWYPPMVLPDFTYWTDGAALRVSTMVHISLSLRCHEAVNNEFLYWHLLAVTNNQLMNLTMYFYSLHLYAWIEVIASHALICNKIIVVRLNSIAKFIFVWRSPMALPDFTYWTDGEQFNLEMFIHCLIG